MLPRRPSASHLAGRLAKNPAIVAGLLAPPAQHLLHRFHLELDEHRDARIKHEA